MKLQKIISIIVISLIFVSFVIGKENNNRKKHKKLMRKDIQPWTAYKGREFKDRKDIPNLKGYNNRCDATRDCEFMCSFTKQAYFCEDVGYICECLTTFYHSKLMGKGKVSWKEVEDNSWAKEKLKWAECYKLDNKKCWYMGGDVDNRK